VEEEAEKEQGDSEVAPGEEVEGAKEPGEEGDPEVAGGRFPRCHPSALRRRARRLRPRRRAL